MGQYKVPQDVEAEDKILGPLTLKQFIYGCIGLGWAFLTFFLFARLNFIFWIIVMLPITLLFGLLAGYKRDGQDFESLLMSLVGFFAQPRRRIWLKEPIAEVFRIEPPKVVVEQTQRDPREVRSQLEQLANMVDSHSKLHPEVVPLQPITIPTLDGVGSLTLPNTTPAEERTIAIPAQQVESVPVEDDGAEDMLDFGHNQAAQAVSSMVAQSEDEQRKRAIDAMRAQLARTPEAHAGHSATPPPETTTTSGMTQAGSDAIIKLATESDDLSVSRIATQANRVAALSEGETVILHNGQSPS